MASDVVDFERDRFSLSPGAMERVGDAPSTNRSSIESTDVTEIRPVGVGVDRALNAAMADIALAIFFVLSCGRVIVCIGLALEVRTAAKLGLVRWTGWAAAARALSS